MPENTHSFEAIKGSQAGSDFYIGMCTLKAVAKLFTFQDADIPPLQRAQRVLRKSRVPRIRDYILQNETDYTFSSLTVSVDGKIDFEPVSAGANLGTIRMSQDAAILINDGQHRVAGIKDAVRETPRLGRDKISVVFFQDPGLKKSQQMFADLNKNAVKPTKSLSILYDRRNPLSQFVVDMSGKVDVFRGRIEMEKTTLSNRSVKFFTLSGLRMATANLLGKSKGLTDGDRRDALEFWKAVSTNIPEWVLLEEGKVSAYELRKEYVHANTNMLEAIGLAGHALRKRHPDRWTSMLSALRAIDWTRTNPEWDGKVIIRGRMTKTKAGMSNAAKIIVGHCEAGS